MVSTSGSLLLSNDSIKALIQELLPLCAVLTPNLPEARQLLKHSRGQQADTLANGKVPQEDADSLSTLRSLVDAAHELSQLGPRATLVKGGHQVMKRQDFERGLVELGVELAAGLSGSEAAEPVDRALLGAEVFSGVLQRSGAQLTVVRTDGQPWADVVRLWYPQGQAAPADVADAIVVDVLYESGTSPRYTLFVKPHIDSTATHGTGCTLSSAIATYLSSGMSVREATGLAIAYVQAAIGRGLTTLGSGPGPLNHACTLYTRGVLAPSTQGSATDRAPLSSKLISGSLSDWKAYVRHPFVTRLSARTLPRESFLWFLKQDYLFLRHYARVFACGAGSSSVGRTFDDVSLFAGMAAEMANEASTHVVICERWGISKRELEFSTRESAATLAYTRYVLDIAHSGDALELLAATGPCLLGYGEVGVWLGQQLKANAGKHRKSDSTEDDVAYDEWIERYAGEEFQSIVRVGIGELRCVPDGDMRMYADFAVCLTSPEGMERRAAEDPPSEARMARLQTIWNA